MGSKKLLIILALSLFIPNVFVLADDGGQQVSFFVNPKFDLLNRGQLTATLVRISPSLYFYLDNNWWNALKEPDKREALFALQGLEKEFDNVIYPGLTKSFGAEWRPGIDNDTHLTILFHPMKEGSAGYVDTGNEYLRLQNSFSNQREMVYLNTANIETSLLKSYLAHEFSHLILFNQKERRFGIMEENWLAEAIAEYSPTLLGYDDNFSGSNLQKRALIFSQFPNDPLIEWQDSKADYGVLNLFTQYLVDQYGVKVLADILQTDKVGVLALDFALQKNGFTKKMNDVFANFSLAVLLNDCSLGKDFCYVNPVLKDFRIAPKINFLPFSYNSFLALTGESKYLQGVWQKITGGINGDLQAEFNGFSDAEFLVALVAFEKSGAKKISFLDLTSLQNGKTTIANFGSSLGSNVNSLVLIPLLKKPLPVSMGKTQTGYPFFLSLSLVSNLSGGSSTSINTDLLAKKIEFMEKQIVLMKSQLAESLGQVPVQPPTTETKILLGFLKFGDKGEQVSLLQTWLSKDSLVYPEGLISGFFGALTQKAVVRFQEKYKLEILAPFGLASGNGFVGEKTKAKLNALYGEK